MDIAPHSNAPVVASVVATGTGAVPAESVSRKVSDLTVLINNWYSGYDLPPTDFSGVESAIVLDLAMNIVNRRTKLMKAIAAIASLVESATQDEEGAVDAVEAMNAAADTLLTKPGTNELLFVGIPRDANRYMFAVEFFVTIGFFTAAIVRWMRSNDDVVRQILGV